MRKGIIGSAVIHGAVVTLILFKVPFFSQDRPDMQVIPVEIVPDAQVADISTPPPTPKKEEVQQKPEPAPPPKPQEAPPAPPPPAQSADAVPPLPDKPAPEKPKEKPKPAPPKPEPRPTAEITPRIQKPKAPSRFDTSRIAALLDKSTKPKEEAPQQPAFDPSKVAQNLGQTSLDNQRQLATIRDLLRAKIQQCWSLPAGAKDAQNLIVRLRVLLRPDGSLLGEPELLNTDGLSGPDATFFQVAVDAAKRAVQRCAPFELPRQQYDQWRETIQNFDPSQMLDVN